MLRIGIIGAENTHCAAIAKLCNVEKKVPARVTMVWGEKRRFAEAAAAAGQIPLIVRDWREMLGEVDGVMIDHRHPKYHAKPAMFFVEHGVPCFVDKPFTWTLAEGKRLCALARRRRVPITSFSTIPLQKNFAEFRQALRNIGRVVSFTSIGPCDLKSKYGGVFFYGIHQVDAVIELFGTGVERVSLRQHGSGGVAELFFRDGPIVTIHCINNGNHTFHWAAVGDREVLAWRHVSDPSPYLTGAQTFVRMFRTGRAPFPHERLLAPVAVLEALAKSLRRGQPCRVARIAG